MEDKKARRGGGTPNPECNLREGKARMWKNG